MAAPVCWMNLRPADALTVHSCALGRHLFAQIKKWMKKWG
jgi:hypothetical protein